MWPTAVEGPTTSRMSPVSRSSPPNNESLSQHTQPPPVGTARGKPLRGFGRQGQLEPIPFGPIWPTSGETTPQEGGRGDSKPPRASGAPGRMAPRGQAAWPEQSQWPLHKSSQPGQSRRLTQVSALRGPPHHHRRSGTPHRTPQPDPAAAPPPSAAAAVG